MAEYLLAGRSYYSVPTQYSLHPPGVHRRPIDVALLGQCIEVSRGSDKMIFHVPL